MLCLHQAVSRNKPLVPPPASWLETTQENHTHRHGSLSARLATTWLGFTNSKHGDLNSVPRIHEKSQAWSH